MTVVINGTTGISTPGVTNSSTTTNTGNVTNSGTVTNASTISVGNATPSSSGAGITFPATQNASSDANTLDDYEEGTWTPAYTPSGSGSVTHTTQAGKYVKVGQFVFCTLEMSTSAVSGLSGYMLVSGLPFTSTSGTYPGTMSVGYINSFNTIGPTKGYVNAGTTTAYFTVPVNAYSDAELAASSMKNSAGANYVIATISYRSAA